MALLGNYSVLHKLPMRFLAGSTTSVEPQLRSNFGKSGAAKNFYVQSDTTAALNKAAIPTGYYPPYTWNLPLTAGEIGSNSNLLGSGVPNVSLAGGKNAQSSLVGAGGLGTPTLLGVAQLISALVGSGNLTPPITQLLAVCVANINATGSITSSNLAALVAAVANLAGSGQITSAQLDGLAVVMAYANLTGGGSVTQAVANAQAALQASLSASATMNSQIIPGAPIVASITTTSSVNATANGLGWMVNTIVASGSVSSTLRALGELDSTILSYSALTPEGIRDTVWNAIATQYGTAGTMGNKLNTASAGGVDITSIVDAVLAALNATQIPVDVKKMNGAVVHGTGVEADKWRGGV